MTTERTGGYFHNFVSEHTPKIGWQEMLRNGLLIPPKDLTLILNDAKNFLSTAEGPNLERRRVLANEWFEWWSNKLKDYVNLSFNKQEELRHKLCPFEDLKDRIEEHWARTSGLLNVAAAEGHAGHVYAARQMAGEDAIAVWAFEQDSYFKHKERPAPFLPLPVRLSMWAYPYYLSFITVNPEAEEGVDLNEHYLRLFNLSGAKRSFADQLDPNREVKIRRGEPGSSGYEDNILRHLGSPSTSIRVYELAQDSGRRIYIYEFDDFFLPLPQEVLQPNDLSFDAA